MFLYFYFYFPKYFYFFPRNHFFVVRITFFTFWGLKNIVRWGKEKVKKPKNRRKTRKNGQKRVKKHEKKVKKGSPLFRQVCPYILLPFSVGDFDPSGISYRFWHFLTPFFMFFRVFSLFYLFSPFFVFFHLFLLYRKLRNCWPIHEKDDPSLNSVTHPQKRECHVSVCIYIYMSPSKTRETESGQGLKFSDVFLGLGNSKKYKIK